MKRLRTASSPYLQPLSGSQVDLSHTNGEVDPGEKIAAIGLDKLKGKGNLLPLLPIPAKPAVYICALQDAEHASEMAASLHDGSEHVHQQRQL